MDLDAEELATVLAALRCFQERYENCSADAIREDWPDHFEDVKPLGTEDIGALCEKLNVVPLARTKLKAPKRKPARSKRAH